jgi:amino acid permease
MQVFSLFAIATSYIGFVLGLSDFFADLLKVKHLELKGIAASCGTMILRSY